MTDKLSGYFVRYMHVERLDSTEVKGLLDGKVYIFPKVDGTNSSIWLELVGGEYVLCGGSRNHKLTQQWDNAGFYTYALSRPTFKEYLLKHPTRIVYGEWLIPHTIKNYRPEAWRRFYVFDVYDIATERFIPYTEYVDELIEYGFDVIHPLLTVDSPELDEKSISDLLDRNHYLLDESHTGEGIVIKRYDFTNKYGRTVWAKVVDSVFRGNSRAKYKGGEAPTVESEVLDELFSPEAMQHEYLKFIEEYGEPEPQTYAMFLGVVWNGWIEDYIWKVIRKAGKRSINFNDLHRGVERRLKEAYPPKKREEV